MGVVEPRNVSRRNRRAWWTRFTFNGITRYDQGAYDLVGGEELSDAEREELLQLCRQRFDAFREQRGEEVGCLLTQKPAASGTGAATAPRSAARSKSGCSPAPKAAANAAGHTSINGPWRWTTSCPKTRAVRTTSATCRPSASAAMPASAMQFAYARGHHRLPRIAGQLRPSPGQLCVLRAGVQRPGAAGERIGSCASPMPIQVRCFQRRGSWRPCRAITRISVPCSRK